MLEDIQAGVIDLAVASRYVEGGSVGEFSDSQERISRIATSQFASCQGRSCRSHERVFHDPARGIRSRVRRCLAKASDLLDLFASSPAPLVFRDFLSVSRAAVGESKLDAMVVWDI